MPLNPAGIGLIFDDELLQDQRFGKRDHRAIDAVDMPLEGDDAEHEGEHRRNDQVRRSLQRAC